MKGIFQKWITYVPLHANALLFIWVALSAHSRERQCVGVRKSSTSPWEDSEVEGTTHIKDFGWHKRNALASISLNPACASACKVKHPHSKDGAVWTVKVCGLLEKVIAWQTEHIFKYNEG